MLVLLSLLCRPLVKKKQQQKTKRQQKKAIVCVSVFVRACVLFFVLVLASCEGKKPPDKALITRQQQGDQVNHKVLILISFILKFHKGFGNAELHPSVLDFSRLLPSTTSFPSRDQQGAAAGHGAAVEGIRDEGGKTGTMSCWSVGARITSRILTGFSKAQLIRIYDSSTFKNIV